MKRIIMILFAAMMIIPLAACSLTNTGRIDAEDITKADTEPEQTNPPGDTENSEVRSTHIVTMENDPSPTPEDFMPNWSDSDLADTFDDTATVIMFNGNEISVKGNGVVTSQQGIKINAPGSYVLSGKLDDGSVTVSVGDTQMVHIVLNGVDLSSSTTSPLYIINAEKTVITLAEGTENYLTDAASYVYPDGDNEPNACLFSNDDITINGKGTLYIKGNYNNGIGTDNDLKIISGTISVAAFKNGLKGKDSISIRGGSIDIQAGKDGLKVKNNTEAGEGYIYIEGGTLQVSAKDDALQAVTSIMMTGGSVTLKSGGKSINCDGILNIASGILQ